MRPPQLGDNHEALCGYLALLVGVGCSLSTVKFCCS